MIVLSEKIWSVARFPFGILSVNDGNIIFSTWKKKGAH